MWDVVCEWERLGTRLLLKEVMLKAHREQCEGAQEVLWSTAAKSSTNPLILEVTVIVKALLRSQQQTQGVPHLLTDASCSFHTAHPTPNTSTHTQLRALQTEVICSLFSTVGLGKSEIRAIAQASTSAPLLPIHPRQDFFGSRYPHHLKNTAWCAQPAPADSSLRHGKGGLWARRSHWCPDVGILPSTKVLQRQDRQGSACRTMPAVQGKGSVAERMRMEALLLFAISEAQTSEAVELPLPRAVNKVWLVRILPSPCTPAGPPLHTGKKEKGSSWGARSYRQMEGRNGEVLGLVKMIKG